MKVIKEGHLYELENFENPEKEGQKIQFIEKEGFETGELVTINDGTTIEEVLKTLIHRLEFMDEKLPCFDNTISIRCLKDALGCIELRIIDRKERGVYGTNKA